MARQAIKEDKKSRIIIPLLQKPCYKGELMEFYYSKKLKHWERASRDNFFTKTILKPFLDKGLIFKTENKSDDEKRSYYDINWIKLIEYYNNRALRILIRIHHKKNIKREKACPNEEDLSQILIKEEIYQLSKICEKHRDLIFRNYYIFKDIFNTQTAWGFIAFSLYLASLSTLEKSNKVLNYLGYVIRSRIVRDKYDLAFTKGRKLAVKRTKREIKKKDKGDFDKLRELFFNCYPMLMSDLNSGKLRSKSETSIHNSASLITLIFLLKAFK